MASFVDILRKSVRGITDERQRERLKAVRSTVRNWRRSLVPPVDRARLTAQLRAAGIVPGDVVMVHSSLSSMTNLEGGAETCIRALMDAVTERGTILMPAFAAAEDMLARSRAGDLPDLRSLAPVNGKITKVFASMPGVLRSSHPFASVCAWGAKAEYLTSGHASDHRIAHRDAPLGRLLELNGKVLGIGISMGPVSFYHVLEDTWPEFPLAVYAPPVDISYIDASGARVDRTIAHYDRVTTRRRIDNDDGLAIRDFMTRHMRESGIRHDFRLAGAAAFWFETRAFYDEMKRLAQAGLTIYSSDEEVRAYERSSRDPVRVSV